jgi:hypothetical protein
MTDLDVQDAAAKADDMPNQAFLAASMIEERAPDIVEVLNDMPPELAVGVLLRAPKVMNPKCSPILNADFGYRSSLIWSNSENSRNFRRTIGANIAGPENRTPSTIVWLDIVTHVLDTFCYLCLGARQRGFRRVGGATGSLAHLII